MTVFIERIKLVVNFGLKKKKLKIGFLPFMIIFLFCVIGLFFIDIRFTRIGALPLALPPSFSHLLGTDTSGRSIVALMIYGIPNTLKIGLVAGVVGTLIGTFLGLVSGYYKGYLDTIIRTAADIQLMIPILVVLVVLATFLQELSVETLGVLIAMFSWGWPTRAVRAQTLSLRERCFVKLAEASGISGFKIMFGELLPNILPYIGASFVSAVSGGILAGVGIQALGLGPQRTPTLGMMLYWALYNSALLRGLWWWWAPPIIILVMIFIGLFLITMGMDEIANPRLKRG